MIWAVLSILFGLPLLIWSAERFIHGASLTASHFGIPPLLIGIFIIGFGTSAPELIVSVIAAMQGNGGLALGNAVGSNITNIALVVGATALYRPILVNSSLVKKELPLLLTVTFFALWLLFDLSLSTDDAFALIGLFIVLIAWSIWHSLQSPQDPLARSVDAVYQSPKPKLNMHLFWLIFGLVILVVSSRVLVWGAVELAQYFGVSDVIIGLTIVGIGTSLPELISCIIAVHKKEYELVIGNIVGSNLFNLLAVVGVTGMINPLDVDESFFYRDGLSMLTLTVLLLIFCLGRRGPGSVNRIEGFLLLSAFFAYLYYLAISEF